MCLLMNQVWENFIKQKFQSFVVQIPFQYQMGLCTSGDVFNYFHAKWIVQIVYEKCMKIVSMSDNILQSSSVSILYFKSYFDSTFINLKLKFNHPRQHWVTQDGKQSRDSTISLHSYLHCTANAFEIWTKRLGMFICATTTALEIMFTLFYFWLLY